MKKLIIKRIKKIGYKEKEGYLYKKWIVADPREVLKIFVNENGYCVKRAVRTATGRIEKYQRISNYFETLEIANKFRDYLIANAGARYDYVIVDFLYCDDRYIEGYELTQEQKNDVIVEKMRRKK